VRIRPRYNFEHGKRRAHDFLGANGHFVTHTSATPRILIDRLNDSFEPLRVLPINRGSGDRDFEFVIHRVAAHRRVDLVVSTNLKPSYGTAVLFYWGHRMYDAIKCIGYFVRADPPSDFLQPLGFFLLAHLS
jgi:hypothetical protein